MSTHLTEDEMMEMQDDQDQNAELEISIAPEVLIAMALRFPCFGDAKPDSDPDELFEIIMNAYRDDNLSEEQDLVVELILHLHEESSPFNLKRALEVWSTADLAAFQDLIKEQNS